MFRWELFIVAGITRATCSFRCDNNDYCLVVCLFLCNKKSKGRHLVEDQVTAELRESSGHLKIKCPSEKGGSKYWREVSGTQITSLSPELNRNISATIEQFAVKFCKDVHGPLRMKCTVYADADFPSSTFMRFRTLVLSEMSQHL